MPHVFHPFADTVARIVLISVLVVPFIAIGVGYWLSASDYATGRTQTPDQPVPFSHQHHVGGLGLDCRYCHAGVENSPVAGVPPTHTCMTCHSQLYTQTAMLAPIRESLANDTPIHWNKLTGFQTTCISITQFTLPKAWPAPPATAMSPPCR